MRLMLVLVSVLLCISTNAQYKSYSLNAKGDTINGVNKNGEKIGKWVFRTEELRGEPGFEEEGVFVKGEKDGYWRKYNLEGDLIGVEHYIKGGKDGLQLYYTFTGTLIREENWRGYNPDSPYDTIAIYGTGSGEIVEYKLVKAVPYSVKHGPWKYYDEAGRIIRTEEWELNNLVIPKSERKEIALDQKPKKPEKTPEMLQWELKNKGKKNAIRNGQTGL